MSVFAYGQPYHTYRRDESQPWSVTPRYITTSPIRNSQ